MESTLTDRFIDPPSADPKLYCRLCFSTFRVEPLFPSTSDEDEQNHHLVQLISSLVQIDLTTDRDASCAICFICQLHLEAFHLFRERCCLLDQSLKRDHQAALPSEVEPSDHSSNVPHEEQDDDMWVTVEEIDDATSDTNELQSTDGQSEQASANFSENEKQLNTAFWNAISKDVGIIPEHVRNSLELVGFSRSASLGLITRENIKNIEQDMRKLIPLVSKLGGGLSKYYGHFHSHNPSKFSFFAGEIRTILAIARAVQENGLPKYLNTTGSFQKIEPGSALFDRKGQCPERMIERIKTYYRERNPGTPEFKRFYDNLPTEGELYSDSRTGQLFCLIQCTFCPTSIRVYFWTFGNFVSHCSKQHYDICHIQPKKKPRLKLPRDSDPLRLTVEEAELEQNDSNSDPSRLTVQEAQLERNDVDVDPLRFTVEEAPPERGDDNSDPLRLTVEEAELERNYENRLDNGEDAISNNFVVNERSKRRNLTLAEEYLNQNNGINQTDRQSSEDEEPEEDLYVIEVLEDENQ
ncbi:uncharacterized protein LOC131688828 [Topomyia yanbarensis]|uniref:uncharacterized protein LOC131688828 n=1 Tax=Topomyia yanbarensis TaxID=2498891 RepID=UPI00273B1D2E|nr:uncharacterized protein LOC131688828 [Topomyia yanbarensis]